jgi:hypothetical protein
MLALVAGGENCGLALVSLHHPPPMACRGTRYGHAKGGHHNGVASFMQGCQKVLVALRLWCDHSSGGQ